MFKFNKIYTIITYLLIIPKNEERIGLSKSTLLRYLYLFVLLKMLYCITKYLVLQAKFKVYLVKNQFRLESVYLWLKT